MNSRLKLAYEASQQDNFAKIGLRPRAVEVIRRAVQQYGLDIPSMWDAERWRQQKNCGHTTAHEITQWLHGGNRPPHLHSVLIVGTWLP